MQLANSLVDRATLGKGIFYPFHTDPTTGGIAKASGDENVLGCILFLLDHKQGDRLMREDMGLSGDLLFSSQQAIIDILPTQIRELLGQYEPRITSVRVTAVASGTNQVDLKVTWKTRSTGKPGNMIYPINVEGAA